MALPWETLDAVDTPEGRLELRRRGETEFLITIGTGMLMSSRSTRSEEGLATLGCAAMGKGKKPRVPNTYRAITTARRALKAAKSYL